MSNAEIIKKIEAEEPPISKQIFEEYKKGKSLTKIRKEKGITQHQMNKYSQQYQYTLRKRYYQHQKLHQKHHQYTLNHNINITLILTDKELQQMKAEAKKHNHHNTEEYILHLLLNKIPSVQVNQILQIPPKDQQKIKFNGEVVQHDLTNFYNKNSRNLRNIEDPQQATLL